MTPYFERDGITIYHGDCLDILPTLGPVDHVITDPPYNVSEEGAAILHAGTGEVSQRRDFGEWDRSEWHPSPFLVGTEALLRQGGSLLAFTSDRLLSAYRDAAGLIPRGTIVWEKTNPPPTPRPAYVSATEWIVWLQKPGSKATWNGSGFTVNLLRHPICGGGERSDHPTQKPIALLRELIQRHTDPGETILDPFAGSGTTGRAALDLGRKAILIEREEKWCEVAAKRMSQAVLL
jgi:site-specific DNA-methyltransferase (adenine-specific)